MAESVLIAEDELLVGYDIADQLAESGFEVIGPFGTVAEILRQLELGRPNCAVLDVMLGDGDVFPAANRLGEMLVPIVFHSGHAAASELRRRYPTAIVREKPTTSQDLVDAVREALRG